MSIYSKSGDPVNSAYSLSDVINSAYDLHGDIVWTGQSHAVSNNYTVSLLYEFTDMPDGTQGIACDSLSQDIAQLYSNKIIVIDSSEGSFADKTGFFNLGHGSTGQFAPQKENASDLYPMLYVSTQSAQTVNDISYSIFAEVKIGESSSTMNRVFYVPSESGYTLFAFDFQNGIVYSVYFSSYNGTTGTGKITAYRLDEFTTFADGSWDTRPVNGYLVAGNPIASYDIDFIPEVEAITFFDGLICLFSDKEGDVYFWDVETHDFYLEINVNSVVKYEREGISFMLNPDSDKYDMILSTRNYTTDGWIKRYYRYQFN